MELQWLCPLHGSRFSIAGVHEKRGYVEKSDENDFWVVAQAVNTRQVAR
jgi:hypothetical protein